MHQLSNRTVEAMQRAKYYLDFSDKTALGENRSIAETYFLKALKILEETHANPAEFVKVYNGLMHVHLDLTFKSEFKIEEREEHLRTAVEYNDQGYKMAQRCLGESGETGVLAQAKLQKAVLYARDVQLRVKRPRYARWNDPGVARDEAIFRIEQALGELRNSNHGSKEKSIAWGKQWQDRLRSLRL